MVIKKYILILEKKSTFKITLIKKLNFIKTNLKKYYICKDFELCFG